MKRINPLCRKLPGLTTVKYLSLLVLSLMAFNCLSDQESSNEKPLPTIKILKAKERGRGNYGWLKSYYTFSFGEYKNPNYNGFGSLKTLNEDWIAGGKGFDPHPHENMEIITYVLEGSLEHKDSKGTSTIIRPNEIHRISAGTGIVHSVYNHEKDKEAHIYQIWILPKKRGGKPDFKLKSFEAELQKKPWVLVLSNTGREGSIVIKQDADVYLSRAKKGDTLQFEARPGRQIWIQMIKGEIQANGKQLRMGDGVALSDVASLKFTAMEDSEFLLFDLV